MKCLQHQHGFVLVTVLLLLAVVTIIVMHVAEDGLLENKMSNSWMQRVVAFYKAENSLTKAENEILQAKQCGKYRHIQQECGVDFCLAEAKATYHNATINLQSTVAVVDKSAHCQLPPKEIDGRQAWSVTDSS